MIQLVGGQQSICALLESLSNHANVTHQGQKDMIHYILKVHIVLSFSLYLHFNGHFSRCTWVSLYQNFSVLDFIGTKDDGGGGDYGSYKTCKAAVKLSPATNQHPVLLQAGCLSCHSTNSVRALMERWKDISYDRSLQLKIFICEYV